MPPGLTAPAKLEKVRKNMFHLDQFISQYVTKRPVSMFSADIEANRQSAGPANEDVDDGPTVCESCGMPLTENANYCANCGAKVEPFVEVEEEAPKTEE